MSPIRRQHVDTPAALRAARREIARLRGALASTKTTKKKAAKKKPAKKKPAKKKPVRRAPVVSSTFRDHRGRVVTKDAPRAREYLTRREHTGRVTAMIPTYEGGHEIVKVTERGVMDKRGPMQGRIDHALYRTNITTVRGARHVEFTIRGTDGRDKERRFKGSLDLVSSKQRKMQSGLIVAAILHRLRARGYRTSYGARGIDWTQTDESKTRAMRRKPLTDVQITVRVFT